MKNPKILFTNAVLPYEKRTIKDNNIDFFYYRNTMYQKVFRVKQLISHHPLHLIPQNQPCPAIVIENPTWSQFTNEIMTGDYDIICITFTIPLTEKILKMSRWIKENYPKIEIILGGHGTVIFNENFGLEKEIKKYVDRICSGEGVSFFRSYLKEKWGIDADQPLKQELLKTKDYVFRTTFKLFESIPIVKAVGCDTGCDFCATSAYFKNRKCTLFSSEQLYEVLNERISKNKSISSVLIYDENYLANKEEVLKLAGLLKNNRMFHERPICLTVFGSLKTLENYSVEELLRAGIFTIFIGIETCCIKIIEEEKLHKRVVENLKNRIETLHKAGINTFCSIIVGWDGHNNESVLQDMEIFADLNPTFFQIAHLNPFPGTKMWERFVKEGRISKNYRYTEDGIANCYKYKNLDSEEIKEHVFTTMKKMVLNGGPWPYRFFHNVYSGYNYLENIADETLQLRRKGYLKMLKRLLPLVFISYFLFFGKNFRKQINITLEQFIKQFPFRSLIGFSQGCIIIIPLCFVYLYGFLKYKLSKYPDQPGYIKKVYHYCSN